MRSDLIRVVICGAALALAGQAAAQQLKTVETRTFADGLKLQIVGTKLGKPKMLKYGDSTILEFKANFVGRGEKVDVREKGLRSFWFGWYKSNPKLIRVKLWPNNPEAKLTITKNTEGWLVSWPSAAKPDTLTSSAKAKAQPKTKPTVSTKQTKPAATKKVTAPKPSPTVDTKQTKPAPAKKVAEAQPKVNVSVTQAPWIANAAPSAKKPTTAKPGAKRVSLVLVNTEVVQILKALAMQSRTNIVTAPEVRGMLTVSLDKVTVDQALDLVTTLTGLGWKLVNGNTYIVADKNRVDDMARALEHRAPMAVTSKVVPIYSGEGVQIKAALIRTLQAETTDGGFEIVLPSEETKVEKTSGENTGSKPPVANDKGGNEGSDNKTTVETKANSNLKDLYMVVMGSSARVDEVAEMAEKLDRQFCSIIGVTIPGSTAPVSRTYQVRGGSAEALAKAVAGDSRMIGNVEISATPTGSRSEQTIVLFGRENEVNAVMQTLAQLDAFERQGDDFMMYDVMHADPRSLREMLVSQVPGLRVTVPPASAGNPRLYEPGGAIIQSKDVGGGAAPVLGAQPGDPKVNGMEGTNSEGLDLPFSELEKAAVPMRLLLRGTDEQLNAGRRFLSMVDIAPKKLALELRVMELSKEDAVRLGFDWSIFTGGSVSVLRFNQRPVDPNVSGTVRSGAFRTDITALLDQVDDKQRMIARPNLMAIDGRESEIFIGDIIRYVSSRSTNPTTGEVNLTIDEVAVGVRLAVLARIGAGGNITMDLRPVVSSITGFLDAGGAQIPQTSSRVAQSTVQIQSGDTIAIGGLIQEQDVRNVSKVPILGDLPIIGYLFRRTENSKIRREVVFFLTAREITNADRNAADPRESERRNPAEIGGVNGGGK